MISLKPVFYLWPLPKLVLGLMSYLCLRWVLNLTMSHCVLHLIGLHLGAAIVVEHTCVCGATVDAYGTHGLSCQRSGGSLPRHASVNETICRALVWQAVYRLFLNRLGSVVMMVNDLMVCP